MRYGALPVEKSGFFAARSRAAQPIFEALRPEVERFLSTTAMLHAAQRRFAETQGCLHGVDGGFEAEHVLEQMLLLESARAPQRVPPWMRRGQLRQDGVHPIRQYFEIPAKLGCHHTSILRQLTTDERERMLFFVLSDIALEGRLRRTYKKHALRWIFIPT